jgi:hypothetical protein
VSYPSTLQANLGPSLAQWTPYMAIGGGVITSKTKKKKKTKTKINIMDEG